MVPFYFDRAIGSGMAGSPGLAFNALIVATVLAIVSESLALRAPVKVMTLIRMIAIKFSKRVELSLHIDG